MNHLIIKKINVAQKKKGLPVFKESVKEGDKRQYRDAYGKYYKTYEAFAREVMNIAKSASKISGNKSDEKIILKFFKKQVIPFAGLMSSWSKGRESNPHIDEVSGVDLAKKVLKNKQYEKGLDLQTANLIVTIDKAYDKNPALQKKFRAIPLQKMKQLVMKYYG